MTSQDFLDSRSPFRVKLDEIRSRGHLEDVAERKQRSWTAPLSHARFEYDVNDDSLLRREPNGGQTWYINRRPGDMYEHETYDFLASVRSQRAAKVKL